MIQDTHDRTSRDGLRRSGLDRRQLMELARTEYARIANAMAELRHDQWSLPTDCSAWDVRQMCCHVVGMAEMAAGVREGARQRKLAGAAAAHEGTIFLDALTDLQVSERADWTPEQVVAGARSVGPRAARARRMTPWFLRRRDMGLPQEVNGVAEHWSLGFLVDTILTRDPWMHRVDLSRATGNELALTADHDGVIVGDVVAEWAERHGAAYQLELSGPAGGSWSRGSGGQRIAMDAVEFCRVLSGRAPGDGLLATQVPF